MNSLSKCLWVSALLYALGGLLTDLNVIEFKTNTLLCLILVVLLINLGNYYASKEVDAE